MRIREATVLDQSAWDTFVDTQQGMYHQYFAWKNVFETTRRLLVPILVEDQNSKIMGIINLVKENHRWYSELTNYGFKSIIFRQDLPLEIRDDITREVISYIDQKYSARCSRFIINDHPSLGIAESNNQGLLDSGFCLRLEKSGLPELHVLPLKAPFEENIWKGLWSPKFRQALNKVEKSGIKVIHDKELKYIDQFVKNVIINYRRHKSTPPTRAFLLAVFKQFGDKMKLFVALKQDEPIALLACIYTPTTCCLWEVGTSTKETNDVNKYCYKIAIADACATGYQFADFLASYTTGLSNLKKRFGTQQIPILVYEKRYSKSRVMLQYGPPMIKRLLFSPKYLWENRSAVWNKIVKW